MSTVHTESGRLECTRGCDPASVTICESFEEQDDGERHVSEYCFNCGHTHECHEPLSDENGVKP